MGKVVGVWGVRGYVKVYSYTREPEGIAKYPVWLLEAGGREKSLTVIECRRQGQGLVAQFEGINDRDQAAALVGCKISVSAGDLPPLTEGEYYWRQLTGLKVVNLEGQVLGKVDHLLETGANDVLVVEDNGLQRLLPYVPEVVAGVDLADGVLRANWQADWDDAQAKDEEKGKQ
jgi:16S rRNA processing protein RimM